VSDITIKSELTQTNPRDAVHHTHHLKFFHTGVPGSGVKESLAEI